MRTIRRLAWGLCIVLLVSVVSIAGYAWHNGYRLYVVHTGSMMPTLHPGDAVLDAPAPTSVHPGEVVTFAVRSGPDSVVTHRVSSVTDGVVHTKGDANRTADPWSVHLSQVVGTAAAFLPRAGYVLVYLKQPQGLASVLTIMLSLTLLWQLFFRSEPKTADSGAGDGLGPGQSPSDITPRGPRHLRPDNHAAIFHASHDWVHRGPVGRVAPSERDVLATIPTPRSPV